MDTKRIYQGDDERWYFNVRGNMAKGPFETYRDAQDALDAHLARCYRPLSASPWPRMMRAIAGTRRRLSEARHP